eukprot:TRINITY_DN2030_c0_g1_i3.p1 TRINITY_DN2030_c0_g1~~TRINITY_DN2030_c0_g1_i3.p1  ORF type:complete len:2151 (-),score=484.82 TRINITY_DN2030_c0_g1_i3:46-6498(-)
MAVDWSQCRGFDAMPKAQGLYDPSQEKDSCGVGMVADIKGVSSRQIVENALQVLENLDHRGARGCEKDTGDGAGILCGLPDRFMRRVAKELSVELPPPRQYAVGNVFLDQGEAGALEGKRIFERTCNSIPGLRFLVWRRVPVESECLGKTAKFYEPQVQQAFVAAEGPLQQDLKRFEAALFVLRKRASNMAAQQPGLPFYVCSLSPRVINYKGMLTCPGLVRYFADLQEDDFESNVALVHSRFSTNTFPAWRRAHPFRQICHNGEINTVKGNVNAARAREGLMSSELLGAQLQDCFPLIELDQTDSGMFDNFLEVLTFSGRSLPEAVAMMMPPAWENTDTLSSELRDYYKYQAALMEPWDGPALVCFTDGDGVGASLDRNGLRPCRYYITHDDKLIVSSECGVLKIDPMNIAKKGRLSPGKMLWTDFSKGYVAEDSEIKQGLSIAKPWGTWLKDQAITMESLLSATPPQTKKLDMSERGALLRAFGYTQESLELLLLPMGRDGEEALGSMGNDAPLACLSQQPRSCFDYFYQLFAQVTNPPIDPIRESIVMSLGCWVGPEENVLGEPTSRHCARLWLDKPCLLPSEMAALHRTESVKGWRLQIVDATFPVAEGPAGLERHLMRVCVEAASAATKGYQIVILSDRATSKTQVPLPALLCCGAVHQALVKQKLRAKVALVVESGEPHEVAHHALLLTFGTDAVYPYMAYEALRQLGEAQKFGKDWSEEKGFAKYQKAVGKGLLKIMAKMGISTLRSYKGAQIADAIGLSKDVAEMCFNGIASQLSGAGFDQLALRALTVHDRGFSTDGGHLVKSLYSALPSEGKYHYRQGEDAEKHMNDPMVIAKLQEAARTNSRAAYASFATLHNSLVKASSIRGQLDFKPPRQYGRTAISLDAVEPASEIVKRFRTGAMSYGSISMEAHSTLAIALNRLGGYSNTGEGGEDPARYEPLSNGDSLKSAIKQVASGRFGVTMEYLSNGLELQIKMAQGAKPGEGGELPGKKVQGGIAKTRNSTPGVGLISPPPHHDIYSIEDLAQLIFDLKNANPEAGVSVKLVSEIGVGVVATGVAKCKADHILISGCDGGTGASKWTGIKHAGAPWELGLAETHQTLVLNGLRGRVTLETDGQLRTGRDVMIAALLGAEKFGFATAPLIAMGCIMMRKCHLNTCPVGIATQDPVLRKKFEGMPEHVVNYLMLVAEEVRVLMAKMGFRSMDELIGHAEVLRVDPALRGGPLQFAPVIAPAHQLPDAGKVGNVEHRKLYGQEHFMVLQRMIDRTLVEACKMTFRFGERTYTEGHELNNSDRTTGTLLSHEVYKRWGSSLPPGTCHLKLTGTSGQSFGAFSVKGVLLELEGDSQDYFGKGLSGGALVVYPPRKAVAKGFVASENIIIGNTALYGATAGVCFVSGIAAERFAVRNSGAWAVVEGAGDHCCEYMTGGRVVVLGPVGDNFGAGMSGGLAWIWDPSGEFGRRSLGDSVDLGHMDPSTPHEVYTQELEDLRLLLEAHRSWTSSSVASSLLERWPACVSEFTRVFPTDYKNAVIAQLKAGVANPMGSILEHLPNQEVLEDRHSSDRKQRVRKQVITKTEIKAPSGLDIEDLASFEKTIKGKRPKKIADTSLVATSVRGFVELDRSDLPKRGVAERVGDFQEILAKKDEAEVQTQASRCMDCGTPFCHQSVTDKSGCPLGNLIPEWNDLVRKGAWHDAFKRLMNTNNFPEFTGRVCPAPCEGACVLGIIDDPVSIKSVELSIIDKAYEMGWMKPNPPPFRTDKRVVIIGSGPCGLAAADQLNKMGHRVTVLERADRIGGLMMYGVPNMKTDKVDVVQRRVDIMKKEGITFITGERGRVADCTSEANLSQGAVMGPTAAQLMGEYDAVLLAVGSTVGRDMQSVPGRDLSGVHLAMDYLTHNTKALLDGGDTSSKWHKWWGSQGGGKASLDARGKDVIVIGGGDTGNDCIGTAVRQGAKSVINLELMPQLPNQRAASNPWPHWPFVFKVDYGHEEAATQLNGNADIRKYAVLTKEFLDDGNGNVSGLRVVSVRWNREDGQMRMVEVPGSEQVLKADMVLLALGFTGPEHPLATAFGVDLDKSGNYKALYSKREGDFQTSNPKVFAAGDCRRGQSLVVWAIKEGRDAASAINSFVVSDVHPQTADTSRYLSNL